MAEICNKLHQLFNSMYLHHFPFDESKIPQNGIYILFEKGEYAHNSNRIVRIGTHTGENQLYSRLKQHFINENKDRSIFRKNIGRCILNRDNDSLLRFWELDLTSRHAKNKYSHLIDFERQNRIEKQVTQSIQNMFNFVVFEVSDKEKRLNMESKIISSISLCNDCGPSNNWFGNFSPISKIRESGLWLVQGLYKTQLSEQDYIDLIKFTNK